MGTSHTTAATSDFRTFAQAVRQPAKPLQPVVDPAGWLPEDLQDPSRCSYRFSPRDQAELTEAVAHVRQRQIPIVAIRQVDFPLANLASLLRDVKRELADGRGIVMLRNFPVGELDREGQAIAFVGLGSHLGQMKPQNKQGHVLGHVKDLGGDYADAHTRGYMTRAEMRFHADACDYVGLLCLQTAKSGGASRVASSVTVYNRMLAARADLVQALTEDFYRSRSGEVNAGEAPWFKQPIFSFTDGYFSATGAGAVIDKAQQLPGVPKFTAAQKEALAIYRQTVDACAVDLDFQPGDIQFLNNFVMLHTRREYEDWPEPSRKRHLLRLWLADPEARPVPQAQREGRAGRGVALHGVALVAPLDADAAS